MNKTLLGVVFIITLALSCLYVFKSCSDLPSDIAKAFKQGTITTELITYAINIRGCNRLQIAEINKAMLFSKKDSRYVAWGLIPLRDVEVEFRVPVTTTYYVDFKNGEWRIDVQNGTVTVLTPSINFNQPGIDYSSVACKQLAGTWLAPFRSKDVQDSLRLEISSLVKQQAEKDIDLVLDGGRKEVGDFIRNWLVHDYPGGSRYQVEVYFPQDNNTSTPVRKFTEHRN